MTLPQLTSPRLRLEAVPLILAVTELFMRLVGRPGRAIRRGIQLIP